MTKLEGFVCVAVPNIVGIVLAFAGKHVLGQAAAASSPALATASAILICTGALCVLLSCISYPLVKLVNLLGRQKPL